ncbi:unnamed protein product, partial [Didymodactylos carnosus]
DGQSFSSKAKQHGQYYENKNNTNARPFLNSNAPPHQINSNPDSVSTFSIELKKLQDEFDKIKNEYEIKLLKTKESYDNQMKRIAQGWQLLNLQIKTQAEAVIDVYTVVCEIVPPITQSIQIVNQVLEKVNCNVNDVNERQQNDQMLTTTNYIINALNDRLQLLTDHHQKLQALMVKQNDLLLQGMNSLGQSLNE